jgi:hypothetical protein
MTKAAQKLLVQFGELPKKAQKEVLVGLLRLPIEARYTPPTGEQLRRTAEAIFLEYDRA